MTLFSLPKATSIAMKKNESNEIVDFERTI